MGSMPTMQEAVDLLLTAEDVALKLKVSKDWVWDHSSRRWPYLGIGGGKKSSCQSERAAASIRADEFSAGNNNAANREFLCEAGSRSGFGICDKIATRLRQSRGRRELLNA